MNKRIRELRIEKNYTQKDLAEKIGVSQTVISKIERGNQILDEYIILRLSDIFQVSADYILNQSEHRYSTDILFSSIKLNPKQLGYLKYLIETALLIQK